MERQQYNDKYTEHKITYGEMQYDGIQQLYEYVYNIQPNIHTFIDIGSGRGKLCMYMASKPMIEQSVGIELVECRHIDAEQLKSKLKSEYAEKVLLVNDNIFNVCFSSLLHNSHANTMIWFSNLCFDQDTTVRIFEKIKAELHVGTIIACSQAIKTNTESFTLLHTILVPMSWTNESRVYIYTF
jgi:hypothetical protein